MANCVPISHMVFGIWYMAYGLKCKSRITLTQVERTVLHYYHEYSEYLQNLNKLQLLFICL